MPPSDQIKWVGGESHAGQRHGLVAAAGELQADSRQRQVAAGRGSGGRTIRGGYGHLAIGERIASQFEVIRAIVSGYSSCCGISGSPALQSSRQ